MRTILTIITFWLTVVSTNAADRLASLPHPILGGELSNSAASSVADIDAVLRELPPVIKGLRELSPFGPDKDPTTYK